MASILDIYHKLDGHAPFALQMGFDNAGFLVGRGEQEVSRLLVALDITEEVIREAKERGCQLIVSHHPIIFHPCKSLTDADPVGRRLLALAEGQMGAICAHTNLDAVAEGVNDALAAKLGLRDVELLHQDGVAPDGRPYGIGRVGTVEGFATAAEFAAFVRKALELDAVRLGDAGRPVHRVAVGGGSCGGMLSDVLEQGCDTFVTADVKHDVYLDARSMGINLIDAGHFSTENVVCPVLANWLRVDFPEVEVHISRRHREVFRSI